MHSGEYKRISIHAYTNDHLRCMKCEVHDRVRKNVIRCTKKRVRGFLIFEALQSYSIFLSGKNYVKVKNVLQCDTGSLELFSLSITLDICHLNHEEKVLFCSHICIFLFSQKTQMPCDVIINIMIYCKVYLFLFFQKLDEILVKLMTNIFNYSIQFCSLWASPRLLLFYQLATIIQ